MSKKRLEKKDCIKTVDVNDTGSIHPLLNHAYNFGDRKLDSNMCFVIPQVVDNKIVSMIKKTMLHDDNDDISITDKQIDNKELDKQNVSTVENTNPLINFSLPVNSNNFLEIVFGINTFYQLDEWIQNIDVSNIEIINIVLNLFWFNHYSEVDNNFEIFVRLNQKIIKLLFNKNITQEIVAKIMNKMLKNNYGKKIKYLDKIKKYLIKYI